MSPLFVGLVALAGLGALGWLGELAYRRFPRETVWVLGSLAIFPALYWLLSGERPSRKP